MTNDELMYKLLEAKRRGDKIYYIPRTSNTAFPIEADHRWNLVANEYEIRPRREYIIRIPRNGEPRIEHVTNEWTRSDFGMESDGNEFILMREVYPEEQQ